MTAMSYDYYQTLLVTLSNTNTDITNTNLSGDLSWSDYCLVLYK